MNILNSVKRNLRACLRPLAFVVALCAASVGAQAQHDQHGGHEGHAAPKKAAPKKAAPKKAAPKKWTPAPRKRAQRTPASQPSSMTPATPAAHDTHGDHDMTQQPAPVSPAMPATTPSQPLTEAATPAAPSHTHTHTHSPAVPQASPTPATGQSEFDAPATPATPAAADHGTHAPAPAQVAPTTTDKPAATVDHSMHTGHGAASKDAAAVEGVKEVSEAEVNELMVMSGDLMGIRNGASRTNFTPMGQMGSGTAWQPATTPMYMTHKFYGDWLFMFHGEAKVGVNAQGGLRGVTKFESQNWIMPMAYRRVGAGTLQLRAMLSLEPLTFSGAGSPQLFQTGEVYKGEPIIDAQHPHDLFMELSAQYTVPVGERATWYAYFGFPGEPALGPVAFMHRASASENPTAPLTHHLQDSTHISFGVFTTGFTYRWFKHEGSLFNGREPD
ncbi:MAG TPA: hypothetical protein VEZ40_20515, partial [Pyrinomonadaceae bacterium]|nr:hypothetical protein [Pyrinomonadaceae bacterium]